MGDLIRNALLRKLAGAEAGGDTVSAERIRARLDGLDAKAAPTASAPETTEEPDEVDADSLDNVEFASPFARKAADEAGMTAETFKRRRRSSDSGFTKADVERIAGTAEDD